MAPMVLLSFIMTGHIEGEIRATTKAGRLALCSLVRDGLVFAPFSLPFSIEIYGL